MTQPVTLDSLMQQLNNNSQYWTDRFQLLEESLDQDIAAAQENARKQYQESLKIIEKQIKDFYMQFADLENISYSEAQKLLNSEELEAFRMTLQEYIELGRKQAVSFNEEDYKKMQEASLRVRVSRVEAVKYELQGELAKLASAEQLNMFASLAHVYEDRYYKTLYTIDNGTGGLLGVSFAGINERQIMHALERPWAADGVEFSHRIWNNQQKLKQNLDNVITQGIMTGTGYNDMAKNLERAMGTGFNNAARIVVTEHAAVAAQAQLDSYKELGVEKYRFVATLDRKTSQICQKLDGQIFDIDDYEVGITVPPMHPNCRSTTSPAIDGSTLSHRKARLPNDKGKWKSTTIDYMTYPEWAKKYNIKPKYGRVSPDATIELVEYKDKDGKDQKRLKVVNPKKKKKTDQSKS